LALYEVVLTFPDHEEVRITDRAPVVGDLIQIDGREWQVILEREPAGIRATARFVCELTREQRARDAKIRSDNAARRERMELLERRRQELAARISELARR